MQVEYIASVIQQYWLQDEDDRKRSMDRLHTDRENDQLFLLSNSHWDFFLNKWDHWTGVVPFIISLPLLVAEVIVDIPLNELRVRPRAEKDIASVKSFLKGLMASDAFMVPTQPSDYQVYKIRNKKLANHTFYRVVGCNENYFFVERRVDKFECED